MASAASPADGWVQVRTPGPVRTLSDNAALFAAGGTASQPVIAHLRRGEVTQESIQSPDGPGPVESVVGFPEDVVIYSGPLDAPAAGLWIQEYPDRLFSDFAPPEGAWFRPMYDDEEDFRVVGATQANGQWQLHAWLALDEFLQIDSGPAPVFGATPGANTVLSSSTQGGVMVAINGGNDGPSAPEVWWVDDFYDLPERGRWKRQSIPSPPDEVTDLVCWPVGCWVAGSRDHQPVVYDFDEAEGAEMDLPAIKLDQANPVVRIAQRPIGDTPMILAVQASEGPTVWTETDVGWQSLSAPPGTLTAARQGDDGIYLIIDEVLWFRPTEEG